MLSPKKTLFIILIVTALALFIALPSQTNISIHQGPINIDQKLYKITPNFNLFGRQISFNPQIRLGLDLQGGTHLILNTDMSEIDEADRLDALESAREIISRRIDLFGVSEPVIQTSINTNQNLYRIIIELPGVQNTQEAIALIGQTAQLDFRQQDESLLEDTATPSSIQVLNSFIPTQLTGKDLKKASVQFDQQTGNPSVGLEFTPSGSKLFAQITKDNIGKPVGIFLDGTPLTLPRVQSEITDGHAVITGNYTTEEAKNLTIQLNAGALPVPIEVEGQNNIGATLGKLSVQKSLQAGLIGLALVMFFMIAYYRILGFLASLALIIYGIITLALYKLLGVTLTLPGMAGFILSVGMAVDSNILIFERTKEELRTGKNWKVAIELGFGRAWDSIKDANVATLMICFILFNPFNWALLNTSGLVRGFALTLALGIFISLFTGIIVTRTLIRLFYKGNN